MLPRKNRISRKDFPSHNVRGFRSFSPLFSAVFYTKEVGESRVSVVVSKKTAKTAVDRNYLRRRFYDIIRLFLNQTEKPFTVVIYPKIESKAAPQVTLKIEIEKALNQAKLIK